MQYKVLFSLIIMIAINASVAFFGFRVGYDDGFINAKKVCNKAIANLTSRREQEVIHEILGEYTGHKSDNDSYDYRAINELFSENN